MDCTCTTRQTNNHPRPLSPRGNLYSPLTIERVKTIAKGNPLALDNDCFFFLPHGSRAAASSPRQQNTQHPFPRRRPNLAVPMVGCQILFCPSR